MRFSIAFAFIIIFAGSVSGQLRSEYILKDNWKFTRTEVVNAEKETYDDTSWETVSVPHDWAIKGPFNKEIDKQVVAIEQNGEKVPTEKTGRTGALPYIGEAWYRTRFTLPDFQQGKQALILFEGAMAEPKVYINGKLAGNWNYGYSYFFIDITELISAGKENILAVHLKNVGQLSRWYPGAGLFRNVRVIVKDRESIDQWGTFVTSKIISMSMAKVTIKTKVSIENGSLITKVIDKNNKVVASDTSNNSFGKEFEQHLGVPTPDLWSPEEPSLYKAVTTLIVKGVVKDEVTTRFGIREISYRLGEGFRLNGKSRKFKGVCLHHDLGPLGTAINIAALRRQLVILKDMGCDAIRSAHNMPSLEQLDLCDELGFMFVAESFDEWAVPKVKNGYNRFFSTDAEKDVVNLVRATRNHPSIVMWSAGNEVPDQWGDEGVKRAKWLQELFHREDPTRPVTVGMDQVKATMESGFGALLDIPGLNYRTHLYEEAYKKFPQGFILGSETASTVSSRGVYKFPVEKGIEKQYPDFQCSSYDLEYCSWSNLPEDDFILQDDKPWVIGEFVWTGFDYLGEPTPYDDKWPSRSSYFGISDLAGLPKDRFYLYRSRWNTNDKTLHILPHWNWKGREGEQTPVFVYTNYDSAELFVNGISKGIKKKTRETAQTRYRLMWMDVKYQPGEILVKAFDNGKVAAEKILRTASEPAKIILEPDRKTIKADGEDLSFVTVSVVDKNGNPCPTANNALEFSVKGAGTFRAVCNGDATSLEPFHLPKMKLFSGKLVVIVQSSRQTKGKIELTVKGKGLKPSTIDLKSE